MCRRAMLLSMSIERRSAASWLGVSSRVFLGGEGCFGDSMAKAVFALPHALSLLCAHTYVSARAFKPFAAWDLCVGPCVSPVLARLVPILPPPFLLPPPRLPSTPQCTAEVEEIRAFFAGAKMLIVSYDLPVKLYLKPCPSGPAGAPVWVAEWNEQAVHARSSGASIADEMPTLWIGCVTNQVRGGTWVMHTWLHVARLGSSQLPSLFAQLHSRTTLFAALCVSPRAFAR